MALSSTVWCDSLTLNPAIFASIFALVTFTLPTYSPLSTHSTMSSASVSIDWQSYNHADSNAAHSSLQSLIRELGGASDSASASASVDVARKLDEADSLRRSRDMFRIPNAREVAKAIQEQARAKAAAAATGSATESNGTEGELPDAQQDSIYLCGNSLGLLPRRTETYLQAELSKWAAVGVEGHFSGSRPWARIDEQPTALAMEVVGATSEAEIATMGGLSGNLHLLLTSFYRPTEQRYKIMMESDAFCSDHHVIRSQVELHGRTPDDAIILLTPRQGESTLRTEDIEAAIADAGDKLALLMLPGVQFYTGQFFDMPRLTAAAHRVGALAGWDCAHAAGNVPLRLHEWGVDFAAWCSYKYLNSGPGSIAQIFVHEKHHTPVAGPASSDSDRAAKRVVKLKGWWGQTASQRFAMRSVHEEKPGAQSFMLSNPPVLACVPLQASLEVVKEVGGIKALRAKSCFLTAYLEWMLKTQLGALSQSGCSEDEQTQTPSNALLINGQPIRILTPSDPSARGCQLSLLFPCPVKPLHYALTLRGIVTDVREPNVLRVSPTPLYNTFQDVFAFVTELKKVLQPQIQSS